jgi:DNA-binding XRE family transcriptional regulator
MVRVNARLNEALTILGHARASIFFEEIKYKILEKIMSKKRNKIRFYRRLLDWTQVDLAESVGITQKVLSDYERDIYKVPDDLKPKITKALGIPEKMIFPRSEA